jgi:CHAT domain-containing protein/Tfp pilus assembly protein PilF
MRSFKQLHIIIIFSVSLYQFLFAQIADRLKTSYQDLLRLNNSRQYQAAILQGKTMVAQEPGFPYAYGQLATAFEKVARIESGLAYFDSLRRQSPENPFVYYAIGMLEMGRKNYEQALGNLKVCIKLNPKYEGAYFQLAGVYDARKDLEIPASYFRTLIQEDSLNAAAHYGLGCVYQLRKEWSQGAEAFGKAIALNPELVHAYYLKGLMHANQRDYQEALETWEKGKEVAAGLNDVELQGMMTANVGNAYHDQRQYQKAISYREEALKLARAIHDKKQEERHLGNLANSYKALRQFDKAWTNYQNAMAIAKEVNDSTYQETLLGNMSAMFVDKGNFKSGVEYGRKALQMAEARGDSQAVASHCWNTGAGYANQADYPAALSYFERALAVQKQSGNSLDVGRLLGNMGNVYKEMGDIPRAIAAYTHMMEIAREISHKPLEEFALGSLGYAYSGWSEYSKANDYFQQALVLAEETGNTDGQGTYVGNIGVVYKKWGNFTRALEKLNQALIIHERVDNPKGVIRHYINMANIYEIRGDYLQALDYEKKALELSQKIGTKNYTAIALGNIGVFYDKIGDQDEALKYLQQALQINQEIGFKEGEIADFANMGSAYKAMGEDSRAEEVYRKSLAAARDIGEQEGEATALSAIGDIHRRKKEYVTALNYYDQALVLAAKIGQKNQKGRLYLNMGNLHLEKGDIVIAASLFSKALEIGKTMDAFDLVYESLGAMAAVAEKQKDYEGAIRHYDQAIEKIESVRERLRIDSYKTKFMESKISIYESVITLLLRLGKFDDAYEYLQRFRARSFLDILSPERIDFTAGITPERFQRNRFYEQKLREMYERLASAYSKSEDKRDGALIAAFEDSLKWIRDEHEKLLDEIRLHHPNWANMTGITQPLSLQEIQQKVLLPGTSLVEYFVGPELAAAWVIDSNGFHCEVLPVKREKLEEMVMQLRRPFRDVKEGRIRNLADVAFDLRTAQQLYEQVFLPLEKHLGTNTQLLIVPDGILHYLPFEALVTSIEKKRHDPAVLFSRYENARYLVEKYAIAYVPSASIPVLARNDAEARQITSGQLLAFGNPDFGRFKEIVPGEEGKHSTVVSMSLKASKGLIFALLSDRDVREVSQIMQPATLYTDKEATEKHFKEKAGEFPNIYLSTHAIADERQPMYSMIAFAQDSGSAEDGFLHTFEIFNLHLKADLVTLSACETGLGKLSRGEGLIGLTRAFMYAGTPSVVVSLWSVDESTAVLMKSFYQNLKKGMSKAEALRQAKLKLIRTNEGGMSFAHPFFWAPFVLVGENQ